MRTTLDHVTETIDVIVDGVTVTEDVEVGQVIRAQPKTGGVEYIRLQFEDERGTYLWSAPLADYNNTVSLDPATEPRWVAE